MGLRLASADTKRLELGDGDYLEVKTDMSKRDFNRLMIAMPDRTMEDSDTITLEESVKFSRGLFETLVVGWSLPNEPTADAYEDLTNESAQAVDSALVEHFSSFTPSKDETSKVSTSRGKQRKG